MINISCGPSGWDCTAPYYITIDKPKTVGEFIYEWLSKMPTEWGYFGIDKPGTIFGEPNCEYHHGKIVSKPLPDEVLKKQIVDVSGSGGWTRSDFLFEVE